MTELTGFERKLADDEQTAVLCRFDYLVSDQNASREEQLSEVREALGEEFGRPADLGEPLIRGAWDVHASQWDRFVYWAARYFQRDDFYQDEIEWKLEIADLLAEAKTALAQIDRLASDIRHNVWRSGTTTTREITLGI